jgi:hypothetical protein
VAALARGHLDEPLRRHAELCPGCREVRLVWTFLAQQACQITDAPLPDAGVILRRAQVEERRRLAERSLAPVTLMQKAGAGVLLALLGVLAAQYLALVPSALLAVTAGMATLLLAAGGVLWRWARG